MVNKSTMNKLTVNELMIYESIAKESITNQYTVNKSTITKLMMSEKHFLIIDSYSSDCSEEFFQFAGDHNIGLVCLLSYITRRLQPLAIGIFESLANVYSLELDKQL